MIVYLFIGLIVSRGTLGYEKGGQLPPPVKLNRRRII